MARTEAVIDRINQGLPIGKSILSSNHFCTMDISLFNIEIAMVFRIKLKTCMLKFPVTHLYRYTYLMARKETFRGSPH